MKLATTMMVGLALGMGVSPFAPQSQQATTGRAGDQQSETKVIRSAVKAIVLIKLEKGHGTGVVIDSARRLVLTNAHVVKGRDTVTVRFHNGATVAGRVLRRGANRLDLALVRLDPLVQMRGARPVAQALTAVVLGCRMAAAPERVTAIGHPGPFRWAVSRGHVAGEFAKFRPLGRALVLDLTIWHGNSGGGLFDGRGRLIGITTAIYGQRSAYNRVYSGFSFAISGPDMCGFVNAKPEPKRLAEKI